jgi:hypothetical protein
VLDHDPRGADSAPVIDIGTALDLYTISLDALTRGCGIRPDGRRSQVPVRLTLGALAVLDAAQRAEDRGLARGDALAHANTVASRYLDLVPDAAFAAALSSAVTE